MYLCDILKKKGESLLFIKLIYGPDVFQTPFETAGESSHEEKKFEFDLVVYNQIKPLLILCRQPHLLRGKVVPEGMRFQNTVRTVIQSE